MKLIAEYNDQHLEVITEARENGGKNHFIEGVFMQSESKNRNGRIYQKPVMEKFINYMKQNTTASALLELYCAWGKTSSSLYAMTQLKKKTLVIVHNSFARDKTLKSSNLNV